MIEGVEPVAIGVVEKRSGLFGGPDRDFGALAGRLPFGDSFQSPDDGLGSPAGFEFDVQRWVELPALDRGGQSARWRIAS